MSYAKATRNEDNRYWYPSENGQMIAGGDSGGRWAVVRMGAFRLCPGRRAFTNALLLCAWQAQNRLNVGDEHS